MWIPSRLPSFPEELRFREGPRLPKGLGFWLLTALPVLLLQTACAGGSGPEATPAGAETPEQVWESLYQPRPEALNGATRVTVSEILLLANPWGIHGPIPAELGVQELLSANLLRRRDVHFVERRRFAQAAEGERRGEGRPRGAPPVGTSPGPELALAGSWAPTGPDSAYLDVRLVDPETGRVAVTFRRSTPRDADPVALARQAAAGLLASLGEMGRLPAWDDPISSSAPEAYQPSGIPLSAAAAFFAGVASEDAYDWEEARIAYQEALELGGSEFFEARVALARIARLRAGGSLGAGDHP